MAKRKSERTRPYRNTEEVTRDLDIIPLEELEITVTEDDAFLCGRMVHTVYTRRKGLHWVTDWEGIRRIACETFIVDSGPKIGTSFLFSEPPAVEPTEEERAANRAQILRIAAQNMVDMGIW